MFSPAVGYGNLVGLVLLYIDHIFIIFGIAIFLSAIPVLIKVRSINISGTALCTAFSHRTIKIPVCIVLMNDCVWNSVRCFSTAATTAGFAKIIVIKGIAAVAKQCITARSFMSGAGSPGYNIRLGIILHCDAFPNFFRHRNPEIVEAYVVRPQIDYNVIAADTGNLIAVDPVAHLDLHTGRRRSSRWAKHNITVAFRPGDGGHDCHD